MLTSADDTHEWEPWVGETWLGGCCLCGSQEDVAHCHQCGHDFCRGCRRRYFQRGIEALKRMLGIVTLKCARLSHG